MPCEVNPKEKEMRKPNRSWMAVAAAALLLGTLAGAVWARPNDRPGAAPTTRKVTLTGADFTPVDNATDYYNDGYYLSCVTGSCHLNAPVPFPTLSAVTIERIKLTVNDANGASWMEADLYRAKPSAGASDFLGGVYSPLGTSGGVKTYTSDPINKVVWSSQRAYITLSVPNVNMKVYGVTVEYHPNS
jgi:hypothetical protein